MANPKIDWKLAGGYSRFLEESQLTLRFEQGPLQEVLELSPVGLLKKTKPLELTVEASHGFRGRGPGRLSWKVEPKGQIGLRILFPDNAFLGNFRVPADHYAIEWDVDGKVTSALGPRGAPFLLTIDAQTSLRHSWVEIFPSSLPPTDAIRAAWKGYLSPFDPLEVRLLKESQVVRWSWSGQLRLRASVEWNIVQGFAIPGNLPLTVLKKELGADAGVEAHFKAITEGEFQLQINRRPKEGIVVSLNKKQERSVSGGASATIGVGSTVKLQRVGPLDPSLIGFLSRELSQPALKSVNRVLSKALVRRLEISLSAEASRWEREATVMRAEWEDPEGITFQEDYLKLLRGGLPRPRQGLRLEGSLSQVQGSRVEIELNLLNWLKIGKAVEKGRYQNLSVTPRGGIVLEEGVTLEKSRHRWDEIEFLKLLHSQTRDREGKSRGFVWTFGREGNFSYEDLRRRLRIALHSGLIPGFDLPDPDFFPVRVRLLMVTHFSAAGLDRVRQADAESLWKALVRSLELVWPARYGSPTFWRDWIDSEEVRETIGRDPIQSHLETHYPIAGRSDTERIAVVASFQKSRRLLKLMNLWKEGDYDEILKTFRLGMDIPIFFFFHLLCPPELRRSAVLLNGGLEKLWGDGQGLAIRN